VVKCETCLIPSRISIRHNMTFCAACRGCRPLKRLVCGLAERLIEVRLVEGVEIFLFATVFRQGVRNTQTLTTGPYPVCKWVTHIHLVLKDKTRILPLLVRTPLWYGAWLSTSRPVPFSQPL
jgi:hypothetical protein